MNRCTPEFLLLTGKGQIRSHVKLLSHFQMDSGAGILISLFTWENRKKENDIYYKQRKPRDLEILSKCFLSQWILRTNFK